MWLARADEVELGRPMDCIGRAAPPDRLDADHAIAGFSLSLATQKGSPRPYGRCSRLRRMPPLLGLERTRLGEALDRYDLCVVLGDALRRQMWIVEAGAHDDGDPLDCPGFHVVDAVCLRTAIACQPDDRWRDSLDRRVASSLGLRHAGARGRVHPRVPD